MTAPHDTQRRGRRYSVAVCNGPYPEVAGEEGCGMQVQRNYDSRWSCPYHSDKITVSFVEVAPVQSEGERDGREQARCSIPHCGWLAHTMLRRHDEVAVACEKHTAVFEAMSFTVELYNPTLAAYHTGGKD